LNHTDSSIELSVPVNKKISPSHQRTAFFFTLTVADWRRRHRVTFPPAASPSSDRSLQEHARFHGGKHCSKGCLIDPSADPEPMSIAEYQLDSGIHAVGIIADQGEARLRRCTLSAWLSVPVSFLQLALPPAKLALTESVQLTISAHRPTAARRFPYRLPPVLLLLGVGSSSSHGAPAASAREQMSMTLVSHTRTFRPSPDIKPCYLPRKMGSPDAYDKPT
jgi:hypothetical protein